MEAASWSGEAVVVCERIVACGLVQDMMSYVNLSSSSAHSPASKELIERLMNILHHVVTNTDTARTALRRSEAVEITLQKLQRNLHELPVISFHCIYCMNTDITVLQQAHALQLVSK